MRRHLCQMWNLSREELSRQDARALMHDTAMLDLFDAEQQRKAAKRG